MNLCAQIHQVWRCSHKSLSTGGLLTAQIPSEILLPFFLSFFFLVPSFIIIDKYDCISRTKDRDQCSFQSYNKYVLCSYSVPGIALGSLGDNREVVPCSLGIWNYWNLINVFREYENFPFSFHHFVWECFIILVTLAS